MALQQRSLLLCALLWWRGGVAAPLGPPSSGGSRPSSLWGGSRPHHSDSIPSVRDYRGYQPQHSDRGSSPHQAESTFWNIQVETEPYGRRPEPRHAHRIPAQTDRHVYNRKQEHLNRHDHKQYNDRRRGNLQRGEENFSSQRPNNKRYDGNVRTGNKPDLRRIFTDSDSFRRRNEVVNDDTRRRHYDFSDDRHSQYSPRSEASSFNGGGSYTSSNARTSTRLTTPRYHFIQNTNTGRDSNVMQHHSQHGSNNERHFRFLSDGFRGPISSGHYEDVPGTSGSYYRRPGGLTNHQRDVESLHQPKEPHPLLQSNTEWRGDDEHKPHRDSGARRPRNHFPEQTSGGYHESYFKGSAVNNGFGSDRYKASERLRIPMTHKAAELQVQKDDRLRMPIQPHLIVKEEDFPEPQPLDASSHHPYSLLYFHFIPHTNST